MLFLQEIYFTIIFIIKECNSDKKEGFFCLLSERVETYVPEY